MSYQTKSPRANFNPPMARPVRRVDEDALSPECEYGVHVGVEWMC